MQRVQGSGFRGQGPPPNGRTCPPLHRWFPQSARGFSLALAASLAGFAVSAAVAAQPEMNVELGAKEVFEGQSVVYRVTIRFSDTASPPKLGPSDDFDLASLGDQTLSSQRVQIVNGRRSAVTELSRVHNYRLTPKRTGTLAIPGPTAQADGQTIKGRDVSLRVLPASAQDLAILQITVDRPTVYPTQTFSVTLSVAIKGLPEPHAERDPLSVLPSPPKLNIPWITGEPPPDGPTPAVDWRTWLGRMQARSGFAVEGVVDQGPLAIFESRAPTFRTQPVRTTRHDAEGKPAAYWVYEFAQKFTAGKVGQYSFGPVTLEGTLAAKSDQPPGVAGKQVYAVAKAATVTAKDVPADGRPENYIGAVGRFRLEAELAPKQAKVGDPMTLTLTLSGQGSLSGVTPPDLAQQPAVAQRFKIYEATQQADRDTCKFTYSLRPLAEGSEPFPAVAVAYFDPEAERFATVQSRPIPIAILKAARLSEDQIVATPGARERTARELEARVEGIFANINDPVAASDESVRPLHWLAGLTGLATLYAAAAGGIVWFRRRRDDPAMVRRRKAAGKARSTLRQAMAAGARPALEVANLVQDSLVGLVADAANLPAAGLTPRDVAAQLEKFGVEGALGRRVGFLLESCDAARYGALSGSAEDLGREAQTLLDELIRALKKQRRFR